MGPLALIDKSFLQSLTVDESVWFDHFFYSIICPLFYVETLADLKKSTKNGRVPEQEVRIIADKFPDSNGTPCAFHLTMAINNLLGSNIPMRAQIPVSNGKPIKTQGKTGILYGVSPENEAFLRWSQAKFQDVEREYASAWRSTLAKIDLNEMFNIIEITDKTCKTLEEAKEIAHMLINNKNKSHECMKLACNILGVDSPQIHQQILKRWSITNYQSISSYAPYAAFVATVGIFFRIALAANLISTERNSNYIDIAYLCYLPFCNIFVSNDKLHKRCAHLFLRPEQQFINGSELKEGLAQINLHYESTIPNQTKENGLSYFACKPPKDERFYVTKIWDKHFSNWREIKDSKESLASINNTSIGKEIAKMADAPPLSFEEVDFDLQDPDTVTVKRAVRKKKGTWYQLPKDLEV